MAERQRAAENIEDLVLGRMGMVRRMAAFAGRILSEG